MGLLSAPALVVLVLLPCARESSGSSGASFGAKPLRFFKTICGVMAGTNKHAHHLRSISVNVIAGECSQTLHYMWAIAVPVWGPRDATPSL